MCQNRHIFQGVFVPFSQIPMSGPSDRPAQLVRVLDGFNAPGHYNHCQRKEGREMNTDGSSRIMENSVFAVVIFLLMMAIGLIVTYIGEIIAGTTRHGVAE